MNLSYQVMQNRVSSFNRRTHFEKDFHQIRNSLDCDYVEKPFKRKGYYLADESGDCIFIDSRLKELKRKEVQFHELTHAILDYPVSFLEFRQHLIAQIFALIFLIPKKDLLAYMQMDLVEIDYRLIPYLKARLYIYQIFKV